MSMNITPRTLLDDLRTAPALCRAVWAGTYKMPWKTCLWVVVCLVYFLSPIDLLPDIIPLLGFADDGAFAVFVLLLVHQELDAFRHAQQDQKTILEAEIIDPKDKKND